MRRLAGLALLVAAACGPKVNVPSSPYEEDDPRAGPPVTRSQFLGWEQRTEAPKAGPGIRTGTIDRTAMMRVLDAGPGQFLRQFEVTSAMDGDRFVGWRLVQLIDKTGPLGTLDLVSGDILIAINGAPLARPDHLMKLWDSLRVADKVVCDLLRGNGRFQLTFTIQPPVGRAPPDLVPATTKPTPPPAPTPRK